MEPPWILAYTKIRPKKKYKTKKSRSNYNNSTTL